MRKADLELLEMRLAPHSATLDRHESSINGLERAIKDLTAEVTDHLRNADANDLAIKQALATVRSLIQRAHRLTKAELGEEEEETGDSPAPVDTGAPPVNTREATLRRARSQTGRRTLL